jgi:hypothetical protein
MAQQCEYGLRVAERLELQGVSGRKITNYCVSNNTSKNEVISMKLVQYTEDIQ